MGRRRGSGATADKVAAAAGEVTRKAGRAARKAGASTEQAGAELAARKPLTAAQAKRMIGISKAVAPLLAPYALAAASVARGRWDAYRAARLGVQPDQLSAYAGPGGALHARLSRVAEALTELESGTQVQPTDAGRAFVGRHPTPAGRPVGRGARRRADAEQPAPGRLPGDRRRAGPHRDRPAHSSGCAHVALPGVRYRRWP